jgi:hypothetical protein
VTLADIWQELAREPGSGFATRRLHPDSRVDLFAYLDLATHVRSLRLIRTWRSSDNLPALPASAGVRCRGELHDNGRQMHVVVELTDPVLADAFTPLVEDLAARTASASDEHDALGRLADGLGEWKQLLESLAAEGMGPLVRRGLAGELLILRDILLPRRRETAVQAWTGPLKANQDFQFSDLAIEVKVTTGKQPQSFRVANERELDERHAATLLLAHLSLDERLGGDGDTLPELVATIDDRLVGAPAARQLMRDRLARVGYLAHHSNHYDEPHYGIRTLRWFTIREGFPRLTEVQLPDGIGDIAYSVTLAACLDFEIADTDVLAMLESTP